jgi:flagellar biosynthesis component FlhA
VSTKFGKVKCLSSAQSSFWRSRRQGRFWRGYDNWRVVTVIVPVAVVLVVVTVIVPVAVVLVVVAVVVTVAVVAVVVLISKVLKFS